MRKTINIIDKSRTWEVATWVLDPMQVAEWISQDGQGFIVKRFRDE